MPRTLLTCLTILAACLCIAQPSCAGTLAENLQPLVTSKDYEDIATITAMTKEQRAASKSLYEGYLAAHKPEAERQKKAYADLAEAVEKKADNRKAVGAAFEASFRVYVDARARAQTTLIANFKSLLSDQQVTDLWPRAERLIRRKLLRTCSNLSATNWYRVDVISCVEEAGLSQQEMETITPNLEAYELAIDKPLLRFQLFHYSKEGTWIDATEAELTRHCEEVGSETSALSRKYTQWIADQLSPESSARFLSITRLRAYPPLEVFHHRAKPVEEAKGHAARLPGLSDDKRLQVAAAFAAWDADVVAANRWALLETDRADTEAHSMTVDSFRATFNTNQNPSTRAFNAAKARCDQMESTLRLKLESALGKDQATTVWPLPTDAAYR